MKMQLLTLTLEQTPSARLPKENKEEVQFTPALSVEEPPTHPEQPFFPRNICYTYHSPLAQAINSQEWLQIKPCLSSEEGLKEVNLKERQYFRQVIQAFTQYDCPEAAEDIQLLSRLLPSREVDLTDSEGQQLLTEAVVRNKFRFIELLLEAKAKIDVNQVYKNGDTILIKAIRAKQIRLVELLLEAGAKSSIQDKHGWYPLMTAVFLDQLDIVKLLLKHHAKVNVKTPQGTVIWNFVCKRLKSNGKEIKECLQDAEKSQKP